MSKTNTKVISSKKELPVQTASTEVTIKIENLFKTLHSLLEIECCSLYQMIAETDDFSLLTLSKKEQRPYFPTSLRYQAPIKLGEQKVSSLSAGQFAKLSIASQLKTDSTSVHTYHIYPILFLENRCGILILKTNVKSISKTLNQSILSHIGSELASYIYKNSIQTHLNDLNAILEKKLNFNNMLLNANTIKKVLTELSKFLELDCNYTTITFWTQQNNNFTYEYSSDKTLELIQINATDFLKTSKSYPLSDSCLKVIKNQNKKLSFIPIELTFKNFNLFPTSFKKIFKSIYFPSTQTKTLVLPIHSDIIALCITNDASEQGNHNQIVNSILKHTNNRISAIKEHQVFNRLLELEKSNLLLSERLNSSVILDEIQNKGLHHINQEFRFHASILVNTENNILTIKNFISNNEFNLNSKLFRTAASIGYLELTKPSNSPLVNFANNPTLNYEIVSVNKNFIDKILFKKNYTNLKQKIEKYFFINKDYNLKAILVRGSDNLIFIGIIHSNISEEEKKFLLHGVEIFCNRLSNFNNLLKLQKLSQQKLRLEDLNRTSLAIGHRLKNLTMQAENAYFIGNDISAFFKETSSLINDLMFQTRGMEEPPREIEINSFIHTTATIFFSSVADCKYEFRLFSSPIHVCIKPAILRDMVLNLFRNSIQHGRANNIEIYTHLHKSEKAAMATIEVWDNGAGVVPEILLRGLGVPGNTTSPAGYGIGLFQIQNDLKKCGGTLSYKRENNYSKFIIHLPASTDKNYSKFNDPISRAELKNKKILLIDDEPRNISIYKGILSVFGFKSVDILSAQSGAEAIKIYHSTKNKILFILCDYFIGRETGIEVFNLVRSVDKKVFFSFISGIPKTPEIREACQAYPSSTTYIQKGVDGLDKIEVILKHALRNVPFDANNEEVPLASETTYYTLFIEGFVHRINNIIVYPMTLSDLFLNYGSKESNSAENVKKIGRLYTSFDLLPELAGFKYTLSFLQSIFQFDEIIQRENLTKSEKNILEKLYARISGYEKDLAHYPLLKESISEIEDYLIWVKKPEKSKKPPRLKVASLLNESTGKVSKVLGIAIKDADLEAKIRSTFDDFYKKIVKARKMPFINSDGGLDFKTIKDFCLTVTNTISGISNNALYKTKK